MRKHGTLTRWNDDRGFGFIKPSGGAADVFVHISAFPRDGRRPQLNELISFEIETAPDGRMRAARIIRPGSPRPAKVTARPTRRSRFSLREALLVAAILAIAGYGVSRLVHRAHPASEAIEEAAAASPYACDGRTMCSQMHSCAEATYFIRHCPNTAMDGDGDGVPCEQQWCN
jgi:cold shock CspA family protein